MIKEMLAGNTGQPIVRDKELMAVRRSIEQVTGLRGVTVKRNPLHMQVEKDGNSFWVDQLSEGEKSLFSLVGDLARRMTIANPMLSDPLEGEGIVLIDEIELHLHPSWQKQIVRKLTETFPKIQFIITTHSPQVLSEVDRSSVFLLYQGEKRIECIAVQQSKGLTTNEILEELMDTQPLNDQAKQQLDKIFSLIDGDNISEARDQIECFKRMYGGPVPEIIRAETLLTFYDEDL